MKSLVLRILLATCAIAPAGSIVSPEPTAPSEEPGWQFRTSVYLWGQSLEGDVTLRGRTAGIDLGFDDICQDLDMAFMGYFEARHDRWAFLLDVNYAEVSDAVSGPFGKRTLLEYRQTQWLVNATASYSLVRDESTLLDVFAGTRFNALDLEIETDKRDFEGDKSWVDPVIGLRYQRMLSPQFFFRASGDIGGFGVASDITWQALAGFGWKFGNNGSVLLGYRAIDTDYHDSGFGYDVLAHGPVLGLEFRF